ncbi:MAG: polysaccharide biosynthesis tyrosine autokinase [Phycisphaerales bacterium]|nr:polysaccharide biosynthesis tyrosine autokinase [Phycisphaerales bacterium]
MSTISDPREVMVRGRAPLGMPAVTSEPGGAAAATGLGPADLLRIIKQHKILIAVSFTLFFSMAVAATFVTLRYFPAYTATGLIQVNPPPMDPMKSFVAIGRPDELRALLETEARKIKRANLLAKVLEQPEVVATDFYRWYEGRIEKRLDDLERYVSASPHPDTQLIRVSISLRNGKDAADIVNTLMRQYVLEHGGERSTVDQQRLDSYKTTRDRIISDLRNKREELNAFRLQSDVSQLETQRSVAIENIGNLMAMVSGLSAQGADLQAQLDELDRLGGREVPITAEMKIAIEADPVLRYVRQNVEALDIEIAAQSKFYGPNHRQTLMLVSRRDGFFSQEAARREQLIEDLRRRYDEGLRQEAARVSTQLFQLHQQLDEAEAKQRDLDRNIERYNVLLRDEESLRRQLDDIDQLIRTAEHAMTDKSNVRVQLAQPAINPVDPSRPDPPLWIAGGFVVSLLLSLGLAFLRELSDTRVRTPLDVVRYGQLSVLGVVPTLDVEEADVEAIETATRLAPQSLVSESFRQIRTTLLYSGPSDTQRTLLITSPRPEDGKSAVAMNLAVTLARGSQRVLLIDANFRRPAIRPAFQNTRPEGLSDALTGHAPWASLVTAAEVPNLFILSSGRLPPSPGELLASGAMRDLLSEATRAYDRVIIDGPPVLMISDALIVATQVDGVILVARAVSSSRGALRRAREVLESVNARIVGCILNGAVPRPGGYFREQYREFYEYTSDETMPFELPAQQPDQLPGAEEPPPGPDEKR